MTERWMDTVEGAPLLGDNDYSDDDDDNIDGGHSSLPGHDPNVDLAAHPWIGEPGYRSVASRARARWRQRWTDRLPRLRVHKPIHTIMLLAGIKGTALMSAMMLMISMFRLVEDAFCHEHYGKPLAEPIDEKECKGEAVQTRLAFLGGIGMVIGAVVGLLAAFPYGILADKWGRRPVLLLSYAGVVMSFSFGPLLLSLAVPISIWLMLIGSTLTLIGGGVPVMINTIYSMASDVSTEETRSSNFLYLGVGAVIAGLVAPPTAGLLMQAYSPWVPLRIIFATVPFMFLAMLALPETLRIKLGDEDQLDGGDHDDGRDGEVLLRDASFGTALRRHVRSGLRELRGVFAIVQGRNMKLCLLPPLIGNAMWSAGTTTLSQHISKYYGWTLAETTYLLTPLGFVNMAILAGLPWVSARLVDPRGRYRLSGFQKDLLLLRAAYGVTGLALLIQAASWNLGVLLFGLFVGTFGGVSPPLARAVITDFVDKKETSRLYAMISIVETCGSFIGAPVVAACFALGMEKGGLLRGLPFLYPSLLTFCALGAMLLVREPKRPKPSTEVEGATLAGDDLGYESAPEDEP